MRLTDAERQLVRDLHVTSGWSVRRICDVMALPSSTVYRILAATRRPLADRVEDALWLMEHTTETAENIARRAGFASVASMQTAIRRAHKKAAA